MAIVARLGQYHVLVISTPKNGQKLNSRLVYCSRLDGMHQVGLSEFQELCDLDINILIGKTKEIGKNKFECQILDWDYLHVTALIKERYFRTRDYIAFEFVSCDSGNHFQDAFRLRQAQNPVICCLIVILQFGAKLMLGNCA